MSEGEMEGEQPTRTANTVASRLPPHRFILIGTAALYSFLHDFNCIMILVFSRV